MRRISKNMPVTIVWEAEARVQYKRDRDRSRQRKDWNSMKINVE